MAINLKGLSRQDLLKLKTDVEKALRDAEIRERQEAIKAAEKAAAKFGFSLDDLASAKRGGRKRAKAKARYRNPENHEQTWSGLGRKPHWIHDALARGADITELEI